MTLKNLTITRKIIDIIHRYGHCFSYPEVGELETEVTYLLTNVIYKANRLDIILNSYDLV